MKTDQQYNDSTKIGCFSGLALLIITLFLMLSCNNTEPWNPEVCEIRQVLIEEYKCGELISSIVPENPIIYDAKDYGDIETFQISEGIEENHYIISTYKRFCNGL